MAVFSSYQTPWVDTGFIDVSADAAYPTTPQVEFETTYNPSSLLLTLDGDAVSHVEYSFDGTNTHGSLKDSCLVSVERACMTNQVFRRIWFKTIAGAVVTVNVQADSVIRSFGR